MRFVELGGAAGGSAAADAATGSAEGAGCKAGGIACGTAGGTAGDRATAAEAPEASGCFCERGAGGPIEDGKALAVRRRSPRSTTAGEVGRRIGMG